MFVLRAKCKLSDASEEIALFGVAGPAATAMLGDCAVWQGRRHGAASAFRLPDGGGLQRALLVAPVGADVDVGAAPAVTLETWRWLEVESGVVSIEAATVDRFVPQMVNFELVGGVDFQKGCYPGQEVVARSQYRGTTKRRTLLFDCDAVPTPGQDVFIAGAANEPAGTVANAAPHPEQRGGSALVEVRLAALGADLRLGGADGPPLRQRPLPYLVPLDVTATA
jgi:folate-binding protein YgfZ